MKLEQKLNNIWETDDDLSEEELILGYEEYTDFNEKQNDIYQNLFEGKILKSDTIKFY